MRYQDIEKKTVRCRCGYESHGDFTRTPELTHYGKLECHECKRFITWVTKPDKPKSSRDATHRKLTKHKQPDVRYCELCLLVESSLPDGQTLEGHHILEYGKDGDATPINTLVLCTECHALVHWKRQYANGVRIDGDEAAFIKAVDQQRAAGDAVQQYVGRVEDGRARGQANQGSIPTERPSSEVNGPKHVGEILPDIDDESCPF